MTNETTASQPKSIGDDAQFKQAFNLIYDAYSKPATDFVDDSFAYQFMRKKVTEAYSLMQKLRAPAAQASATIQAAPQGYVLAKQTVVEMPDGKKVLGYTLLDGVGIFTSHEEVSKAISTLSLPLGWVSMTTAQLLPGWQIPEAATIQEPVMVAEPVDKFAAEVYTAMRCFDGTWGQGSNEMRRSALEAEASRLMHASKPAAPMVADPAGVTLCKSCEGSGEVTGMVGSGPDGWEETRSCPDCGGTGALAATVKAVPSEALDAARLRWLIEDHDDAEVREKARELAGRLGTSSYFAITRDIDAAMKIAAPLADKTGGGE